MPRQAPSCDDCYFRRNGLCALVLEKPCPTFRAATKTLQPPLQPPLVARPLPVEPAPVPAAPVAVGAPA